MYRQRRLLLGVMAAALLAGAAYLATSPAPRVATARVCVQQVGAALMPQPVPRPGNLQFMIGQCELIRSEPVVGDALRASGASGMRLLAGVDDPVGWCRDRLRVRIGADEMVITISLESEYPAEAARLVDAIVDSYLAFQKRQARASATEVAAALRREQQALAAELGRKSQALAEFKKTHGTMSFAADGGNVAMQRLGRLTAALTEAQIQTMQARAAFQTAETYPDDPAALRRLLGQRAPESASVVENEIRGLSASLDEAELRLATLGQRYAGEHPSMQAAQAAVSQIKGRLAEKREALAAAWVAETRSRLEEAEAHERQVAAAYAEQRKEALAQNDAAAEHALLEADLQRVQQLHAAIEGRINDLNVAENAGMLSITVLERADAAGRPVGFRAGRVLGLALLAGALLGGVLAMLREVVDKRFRSSREVVEELQTPVLGVVPRLSHAERAGWARGTPDASNALVAGCRMLRASLRFGGNGAARRLLVSSPAGGDGRTTVAAGIAVAAAQAGQRVLLIDADGRHPAMHRLLGIGNDRGLSSLLGGDARPEGAVCRTAIDGLDALPAGPPMASIGSLLEGEGFASLLERVGREYDQVIIDAPPACEAPEALALAGLCDGVVLVLRAGRSLRPQAWQTVELLRSVGANVAGVMVNAAPRWLIRAKADGEGWYCLRPARRTPQAGGPETQTFSLPDRQGPSSLAA